MKVKDVVKKINYASAKLPIYMKCGLGGYEIKVTSWDCNGYCFEEQDRTVMSISIEEEKVIIYYK